jgi:hypothetical protein
MYVHTYDERSNNNITMRSHSKARTTQSVRNEDALIAPYGKGQEEVKHGKGKGSRHARPAASAAKGKFCTILTRAAQGQVIRARGMSQVLGEV